MAPGIQAFTRLNYGKETVRGTPVAPTRQMYADGTGVLDEQLGLNFHEGENRGRRAAVYRVTQQSEDATLKIGTLQGVSFDDFVLPLTQLKGGLAGVGGAADKTWTCAPSMTAANNPEAFSFDVGDDVQNWRTQYSMMKSWEQSAGRSDLTQLVAELFVQRAVKTAAAAPGVNNSVRIPSSLWTFKFAATFGGLAGAAVQLNLVKAHKLHVDTGLLWDHYQDGNLYGSQHVETVIGGTLDLEIASTAFTISEFYDKAKAQTQDYVRLKATSPVVLGGSFYSLQHDCPILFEEPKIIAKHDNGINIYTVRARLNDDGANPPITSTLVCSLAAIP